MEFSWDIHVEKHVMTGEHDEDNCVFCRFDRQQAGDPAFEVALSHTLSKTTKPR